MPELPFAVIEDKSWESVVEYIDRKMTRNRQQYGKFNIRNEELYHLKKAMKEVDPAIENVGKTFHDYENKNFGGNK